MVVNKNMKPILPFWVEVWLFLSALICLLDVGFTMLRPHTIKGGQLGPFYYLWHIYADVDIRYATTDDIVTCASGRVMLIEIFFDIVALVLARYRSRHTLLVAFMTTCFVFWKTVWFLTLYIAPPQAVSYFTATSSNLRIFLVFWIPNGVWIVLPFMVMIALWNRLALPFELGENYHKKMREVEFQVVGEDRLYRSSIPRSSSVRKSPNDSSSTP